MSKVKLQWQMPRQFKLPCRWPDKRGRLQKIAYYSLAYGASVELASEKSGLSLRRVKVIRKYILRNLVLC